MLQRGAGSREGAQIEKQSGHSEGSEETKRLGQIGDAGVRATLTGEEEKMLLENRITTVLGKLSGLKPDTPEYMALDAEFRELIAKRES